LPAGSNSIDFAYRIHTNLGHRCVGAKVNGRIVPLNYTLQNGDIVEVLTTNKISGPSRDWLKMARTSGAKSKIRAWFKKEQREENISKGQDLLEKEVQRLGLEPHLVLTEERLARLAVKYNFQAEDDLLASIGYGGTSLSGLAPKLVDDYRAEAGIPDPIKFDFPETEPERPSHDTLGVRVRGLPDALIRFSRCCNPVPGDPIIGYITRGRGVSVHTTTCPNALALQQEKERLIDVYWEEKPRSDYPVRLELTGVDRIGLLQDVVQLLAENKLNISSLMVRTSDRSRTATITFTIVVRDRQHLEAIMERLSRLRDVFTVHRVAAPGHHS
jgi:GTP pyrophosphokinase